MELGGRICLSDDSHGTAQVGLNYWRMKDYLSSMGVKEIWHLVGANDRKAEDITVGTRQRVFGRRVSAWTADSFWDELEKRQALKQ